MIVLAVANRKGGVGKTTIALALALWLAGHDQTVLAIDLDSQGHLTIGLGQEPESLLPGWLTSKRSVESVYVSHYLSLIPGGLDTEILERGLQNQHTSLLRKRLRDYEGLDWCILDCPPSMGMMTQMALYGADYLLIPTVLEPWSVESVYALIQTLETLKTAQGRCAQVMGIVPNMARKLQLHVCQGKALVSWYGYYRPEQGKYGGVWPALSQTTQISKGQNPWESLTSPYRAQWEYMCQRVLHYGDEWRKG